MNKTYQPAHQPTVNEAEISARIDRLPTSSLHRRIMLILALPLFAESCDINTMPSAAPALLHAWGVSMNQLASITSASFFGMFFGALIGGWMSDRLGRKLSLTLFVGISALASLMSALAGSVPELVVARAITGFGIASGMVTAMTYVSEMFPARSRGTWQAWSMVINLCALPVTNWVARLLVPAGPNGWRWLFVWGAVGLIFPLLWKLLPESPRWCARMGQSERAERGMRWIEQRVAAQTGPLPVPQVLEHAVEPEMPWTTLFNRLYRKRMLMLCAIWMLQTIGLYGFEAWVPTLLVRHGMTIAHSLTYFTLINIGAPIGALAATFASDRFERKHSIALVSALIAVCGILYGLSFEPAMIVGFGMALGVLMHAFTTLLYTYTPEQFPTGLRTRAVGIAYSSGRIVNVGNTFVIAALYGHLGYISVFAYIGGVWLLSAAITMIFGARTTGRSFEVLNPETPEASALVAGQHDLEFAKRH